MKKIMTIIKKAETIERVGIALVTFMVFIILAAVAATMNYIPGVMVTGAIGAAMVAILIKEAIDEIIKTIENEDY